MCHQTLQGTQCTGARLYLWPLVQTKRKVTPLVSAAVSASPGEQTAVCSPSCPLPAVLHAHHSTRGGQRRCVCPCLVQCSRWRGEALHGGHFNFSTSQNEHTTILTLEAGGLSCFITYMSAVGFRVPSPVLHFKKYCDTHTGLELFVKRLPASMAGPGFS